jgi:hypothetical protein
VPGRLDFAGIDAPGEQVVNERDEAGGEQDISTSECGGIRRRGARRRIDRRRRGTQNVAESVNLIVCGPKAGGIDTSEHFI